MIVSIRGTSGSGKSTLARKLMGKSEPIFAASFPTTVIFLKTPLELCLARVNERRRAKLGVNLFGDVPDPVSPKKTTEKYKELERVADRIEKLGVPVERLQWRAALERCQELLR